MSSDLFFEYFYEESRELLKEIGRVASALRLIDIPDSRQEEAFNQCVQKLHRLIGGMASIGFEMYATVSHKTSLLAQRCSGASGHSIKEPVAEILKIITDLSMYFTSVTRVKEIEILAARIEKGIDACMNCFQVKKNAINSQSEIDDIMKMFGKV